MFASTDFSGTRPSNKLMFCFLWAGCPICLQLIRNRKHGKISNPSVSMIPPSASQAMHCLLFRMVLRNKASNTWERLCFWISGTSWATPVTKDYTLLAWVKPGRQRKYLRTVNTANLIYQNNTKCPQLLISCGHCFVTNVDDGDVTLLTPFFERGKVFVFQIQNWRKKLLRRNGFSFQKRYISTCLFHFFGDEWLRIGFKEVQIIQWLVCRMKRRQLCIGVAVKIHMNQDGILQCWIFQCWRILRRRIQCK